LKFVDQTISGIILVEPDVHRDARGFFLESYHAAKYREAGIEEDFVQDNHSLSQQGTLRGLHMQVRHPQAKLIRVIRGEIWDVAVDLRKGSPTFGDHFAVELSGENHRQLFVATGLAHGFLVMSDEAEVEYKCSDVYDPEGELSVAWNDAELGIPWPTETPILSDKDRRAPSLARVMDHLPEWKD
jgi:dTDP-4-dehydrorhamnose 3,5-epimerase